MAKLNVVIPAVEVTVDGVAYRKVDRKAQAGDVVKALKSEVDLTEGAFYGPLYRNGVGNLGFYDDVDDFRYSLLRNYAEQFAVYAPISEPISEQAAETKPDTITFQGAEWRKVDRAVRKGDAIKLTDEDRSSYLTESELYVVDYVDSCDGPQITDDDGDEYDAGSEDYEVYEKVTVSTPQYREVKRKADVGERIKITNRVYNEDRYVDDAEFIVKKADSDGDVYVDTETQDGVMVLYSEYVVLELVTAEPTKPERLAVGDYARVTSIGDIDGSTPMSYVNVGDIFEISEDDKTSVPYYGKRVIDGKTACLMAERLVRATDEEVAAAKDPRSQFAAGDKVRLVSGGGERFALDYTNGGVYTVKNPKYDSSKSGIQITGGGQLHAYVGAEQLVKLTAGEVAEIERKQAEEAKWAAIGRKVNEYKRGDVVEIILDQGGDNVGTITEVVSVESSGSVRYVSIKDGETKFFGSSHAIKLIVPVEQRFDTEEVDAA